MDNRNAARAWQLNGFDPEDAHTLKASNCAGNRGRYWMGYAWGYVSHFGGWAL